MTALSKKKRLKKELGLFDVYAVATGTTLSAGFFLLPGLAAQEAGPALVFAYLLAALPMVPAMFSVVELATAMPRAGGVYYFLDRSLGPMVGTIGGIGTWLALMLKVAFALVGMGAYLRLFFPSLPLVPVAVLLALLVGAINLFGAKKTGLLQSVLVVSLLAILGVFLGGGLGRLDPGNLQGMFDTPLLQLLSTAGFVYISYVGVTKVASLSEEVKDPEQNLPRGVFLALGTALVIYGLGTLVMVGVVPIGQLTGDLTPVATAARGFLGGWGAGLVSLAALFAFTSVANAGTLSASRYPLAMSRDRLMPQFFQRLNSKRTPVRAVLATVTAIVLILLFLNPTKIAKLASAFQLLMFALVCLAVIVMRESRIEAYDPGYRSPFYPWMQILGLLIPFSLIILMGWLPTLFSLGLIAFAVLWYRFFARKRVSRSGAVFHLLARLGEQRMDGGLEQELRLIMREKGLRVGDPFDEVVARARVIDLEEEVEETSFDAVVEAAAEKLAQRLPASKEELSLGFQEGTKIGVTAVTRGVSFPHLRLFGIEGPEMVLVRSRLGVAVDVTDVHGEHSPPEPIYSFFFLVSPEESPQRHLRILAQLAERVDDDTFLDEWRAVRNEQELKEILLRDERFLSLELSRNGAGHPFIGRQLKDLEMPEGTLVALIRRRGQVVVPRGSTVLEESDRLTIIGEAVHIRSLKKVFVT